jgi:hypothetical protein
MAFAFSSNGVSFRLLATRSYFTTRSIPPLLLPGFQAERRADCSYYKSIYLHVTPKQGLSTLFFSRKKLARLQSKLEGKLLATDREALIGALPHHYPDRALEKEA